MSMKVKREVKAQKDYTCEACGGPILPGTLYQWAKPFRGPKRTRHADCPTWKASELETGAMADAYAAQEAAHDNLDGMDLEAYGDNYAAVVTDAASFLSECSSEAEAARDQYQESLDNMPEGLQQGPTGEGIQEKIDLLEQWFDELNDWQADAAEEFEEFEAEEWFEEVIDSARAAVDSLEA